MIGEIFLQKTQKENSPENPFLLLLRNSKKTKGKLKNLSYNVNDHVYSKSKSV